MNTQINEYIMMFINAVGCATIAWFVVRFGMSFIFNAVDKLNKNQQKEENTTDF
ncbi:MAG: hypothetical protein IKF91_03075 [Bacilli bacterium]|nr:hypothetical protein [Bacilli bacterium]